MPQAAATAHVLHGPAALATPMDTVTAPQLCTSALASRVRMRRMSNAFRRARAGVAGADAAHEQVAALRVLDPVRPAAALARALRALHQVRPGRKKVESYIFRL